MKLAIAFACVAAAAAVAPPRIELNLAQMSNLQKSKRQDTDWTERCPASARTNVQNCPFPQATAFDHNNNEIPVTESVYRVTIKNGKEVEQQVKKVRGQYPVKWSQTGIYLFKYAATDAVGNDAEHIVFELVLDDVVKPMINCKKFDKKYACPSNNYHSHSTYSACVPVFAQPNLRSPMPECSFSDLVTPEKDLSINYKVYGCADNTAHNSKVNGGDYCADSKLVTQGSRASVVKYMSGTATNNRVFNRITSYKVSVEVKDNAGIFGANGENNFAIQSYRIGVVDTVKPVVAIVGAKDVYMECGTSFMRNSKGKGDYIDMKGNKVGKSFSRFYHEKNGQLGLWKDSGAKVTDNYDCNVANRAYRGAPCKLTAHAVTNLNVFESGVYHINYEAVDSSGNAATSTRNVHVVDDIAPKVRIVGANPITFHRKQQNEFNDPGVMVTDNCDNKGDSTMRTGATFVSEKMGKITTHYVDSNGKAVKYGDLKEGTYTKVYKASDRAGNVAKVFRKIIIVDQEKPILKLVCKDADKECSTEYVEADHEDEYTDEGATCQDYVHGNLNRAVRSTGDIVKRDQVGTYHVTYTCKDPSGNHAVPITRTIIVSDRKCPTVTLKGPAKVSVEAGFPFRDTGASCSDSYDKSLKCTAANNYHSYGNNVNYAGAFASAGSCHEIKSTYNQAASGYYTITVTDMKKMLRKIPVYCDMTFARTYFVNNGGKNQAGANCRMNGMTLANWKGQDAARKSIETQLAATYFTNGKTNTYLCSFKGESTKVVVNEARKENYNRANIFPKKTGSYVITYAATDASGNMAMCKDGLCACPPTRTVTVKDTLPPVIALRLNSKLIAMSRNPGQTKLQTAQNSAYRAATQNNGNPFLSLMAESTTTVNGWAVAAVASLVMGVALLSYSRKGATSVPV